MYIYSRTCDDDILSICLRERIYLVYVYTLKVVTKINRIPALYFIHGEPSFHVFYTILNNELTELMFANILYALRP